MLEQISMERIRDELLKILASRNPRLGITWMCDSGLMDFVIPQLVRTKGCKQNKWHTFDVWGHSVSVMEVLPPDPIFRLAGLLHDVGKPDTQSPHPSRKGEFRFLDHARVGALYVEGIAKRLKLSSDEVKRITHLTKHHMRLMEVPQSESGIRKLIRDLGSENVEEFITLRRADMVDNPKEQVLINEFDRECNRIREVLAKNPVLDSRGLVINGHDIMKHFGIKGGPIIGKMMGFLTEIVINNPELNTKESLLQMLEKEYENTSLE
jgi:tRNA nucleotidyltransferase (CCA-adding enzyme)